jgi:hypothetical protein
VFGHGEPRDDDLAQRVTRDRDDPGRSEGARVPGGHRARGDQDRARVGAGRSGQRVGEFALTVASDAGYPQDLASAHLQVQPAQPGATLAAG